LDLSVPRGVDDVEPGRYARQDRVRRAFEEVSKLYNFQVMEPASLEHLGTLRAKSGEEVDKEIYNFKDKGGRDLGLRFDLTVGITRYVCSRKDLRLPVKLSATGGIWRYDEPQYGRYRWSHQWDLEVFGPPSVGADAEVIDASAAILRKSGLSQFVVKIGDRRVVEDFVRKRLGISQQERIIELMRALDKVEKKTTAELHSEYTTKGFGEKQVDEVLDFGKLRGAPDEVLAKASELKLESVTDLRTLADNLESRGLKDVEYNMSIVRGIDYYTGIVFEAADIKNPRLGSLFGGGRYDALPKIFGRPDLSATGAAGGIERIAMSLPDAGGPPAPTAYVAVAGGSAATYGLRVLNALREAGVSCESPLGPKTLSKQMEDASRLGVAWTLVVGEKEAKSESVTLRDMKSGREELLALPEAMKRIGSA
jgi:histidyl-tRNA synthetase